jgi:hypothetical protein
MKPWTKAVVVALLWIAGMGAVSACGNRGNEEATTSRTRTPSASAPASASPAMSAASPTAVRTTPPPGGTAAGWTTGPLAVNRSVPVPPVPTLLRIRSAAHSGYDRITFDFADQLPGYQVRYVDKVIEDGTGRTVAMPGRRYLQIRFEPAQAHSDSGDTAVTPRSATVGSPMLRGYAINGDFEGVVNVALGLEDAVAFRVGEISGTPARIYVDVAA